MRKVPSASKNIAKVLPTLLCIKAALYLLLTEQIFFLGGGGLEKGNISIDTPLIIIPKSQRNLFFQTGGSLSYLHKLLIF